MQKNMMVDSNQTNVSLLLEIEQTVRRSKTLSALKCVLVNETRRLVPCSRIALFVGRGGKKYNLSALSDLPDVDRTTPFAFFSEALVAEHMGSLKPVSLSVRDVSGRTESEWRDLAPPEALLLPLTGLDNVVLGILLLFRDTPWTESERFLLGHLGEVYGHAMQTRGVSGKPGLFFGQARIFFWIILSLLFFLGFIPVRMSALAPVEVTPQAPWVLTSPLNGVVRSILVRTNDVVVQGQEVAELEDTVVRNQVAVAEQSVLLASVILDKGERSVFQDPSGSGRIAEFQARLKLRRAELAYSLDLLAKTRLTADRDGVAVVTDPLEWQGRPVSVGQRILMIADPDHVELKIMLPVSDAVTLYMGSPVRVFLDSDPLSPLEGAVVRWEYEPRLTVAGVYAYHVTAELKGSQKKIPRIGLRGTAKVHGPTVSLYYYLFRRPLTALRQRVGW